MIDQEETIVGSVRAKEIDGTVFVGLIVQMKSSTNFSLQRRNDYADCILL